MATTTIPERIELEYMLDQRRLMRDLAFLTLTGLRQRTDSEELLAAVGLSAVDVLNPRKLRRRLRWIAERITEEKLLELARLLNKRVPRPSASTIDDWVERQAAAILAAINQWLALSAGEINRARLAGLNLAATRSAIESLARSFARQRESEASAAVLGLNAQIIEEVARGAGSTGYRWMTTMDGRQRAWHGELNLTVQTWDKPPLGGGTKRDDKGHAGSGYGCRCLSELL